VCPPATPAREMPLTFKTAMLALLAAAALIGAAVVAVPSSSQKASEAVHASAPVL